MDEIRVTSYNTYTMRVQDTKAEALMLNQGANSQDVKSLKFEFEALKVHGTVGGV